MKMFVPCKKALSFFGPALLLAGCASTGPLRLYDGDPLPAGARAVLEVPVEVNLLSVNGKAVSRKADLGRTKSLMVELLPGEHTVEVRYYMPGSYEEFGTRNEMPDRTPPIELPFRAQAGGAYIVSSDVKKDGIRLWIDDVGSGLPAELPVQAETAPVVAPGEEAANRADMNSTGLQEMKLIWSRLPEEDRKDFRRWIIDQP